MTTTTGPDLRRTHPGVWHAPDDPELVVVPPVQYLMVDGAGDPSTAQAYTDAVQTLYAVSYGVRALVKASGGTPWTVMPLEGLWWADDLTTFTAGRRDDWLWTMLIAQHDGVTAELVGEALDAAGRKKKAPAADRLRLEVLDEGEVVQVLHHGPYSAEGPTIERLHAFAAGAGRALRGRHHEVYLSDPRRVAPERMRTILRQPVGP
ncbi:GyrI-like domain-containing protein [Cellulomonas sp. NS3]|uniref:GyrI-like domain-containing protein n=1 Tax=Cellulomonas sp. NS3 TaxID=2973977 RepID=UPI0021629553|nr:GyrI-like domain-containing protein [Cellulomonas sp. NS3]